MNTLTTFAHRWGTMLTRVALAIVFIWIGLLHFGDTAPVEGILMASPVTKMLAVSSFVYLLGAWEVLLGVLLLVPKTVRYGAVMTLPVAVATIVIFLTAPALVYTEAGFPLLSLPGEFILKDLVLGGAALLLLRAETA